MPATSVRMMFRYRVLEHVRIGPCRESYFKYIESFGVFRPRSHRQLTHETEPAQATQEAPVRKSRGLAALERVATPLGPPIQLIFGRPPAWPKLEPALASSQVASSSCRGSDWIRPANFEGRTSVRVEEPS